MEGTINSSVAHTVEKPWAEETTQQDSGMTDMAAVQELRRDSRESLEDDPTKVDMGVPDDVPDVDLPRESDARPDLQADDVASTQSTVRLSPLSDMNDDNRNAMVAPESSAKSIQYAPPTAAVSDDNRAEARVHFDESSSTTGGVSRQDKPASIMSDVHEPQLRESPQHTYETNDSHVSEDVKAALSTKEVKTRHQSPISMPPAERVNGTAPAVEMEEGQIEEGEIEEGQIEEEEDEDDVVIRPRSRSKRTTVSQEPEPEEPASKKVKADTAPAAAQPTVSASGVHINEEDDEEGNTKVTEHGELKGDRVYSSRAFRLPMRGDTFYFLATEIARVSGYRDSYLLFNKNRNLKKLMTTEAEKAFLIQQELIPYSYRNRQIGVVNALSIYKTFGARVVTRGMRVKDDYYAQRARDQGFTEADYANEEDRPVEDRLFAQAEAQRRAETDADVALASKAANAVDYNISVNAQRKARAALLRQHFQRVVHLP